MDDNTIAYNEGYNAAISQMIREDQWAEFAKAALTGLLASNERNEFKDQADALEAYSTSASNLADAMMKLSNKRLDTGLDA